MISLVENHSRRAYIAIFIIFLLSLFVRLHNTGGLTGGDDSQYAFFTHYILNGDTSLMYPRTPDVLASTGDFLEARPMAMLPPVISTLILGRTSFAIQFPSALFGAISVVVLFAILRKFFTDNISLTAAFLLAVNPFHVSFTRVGINDGLLTLLALLTTLFVIKGILETRPGFFYLAGMFGIMNLLTTNYRGAVPLISLLPFVILSKPNKRLVRHLVIAATISLSAWLGYYLLPFIWGDGTIWEYLVMRTFHAAKSYDGKVFFSFWNNLKIIGMYQYLTPFVGFIVIPAIFGLVAKFRNLRNPINALWVTWFLSALVIYWQGQPYPNRHAIIIPSVAFLAAVGIFEAKKKLTSRGIMQHEFPALVGLTVAYILLIIRFFPIAFPIEWIMFKPALGSTIVYFYDLYISAFIPIITLTLLSFVGVIHILDKQPKKIKETIYASATAVFLVINLMLILGLVVTGVAKFHRPSEIETIGTYLLENTDDVDYSCLANLEDRSLTYYTRKICAGMGHVDLAWVKSNAERGNLKFFVENLQSTGGNSYLGGGTPEMAEEFPEIYSWIRDNSDDVTAETGIWADNPYFRVYKYTDN